MRDQVSFDLEHDYLYVELTCRWCGKEYIAFVHTEDLEIDQTKDRVNLDSS